MLVFTFLVPCADWCGQKSTVILALTTPSNSGGTMPPGNARTKLPVKVIERTTAEACLAIAHKVQQAREGI